MIIVIPLSRTCCNKTAKTAPTYDFAHAQRAKSLSKALGTRVYPDECGPIRKRLDTLRACWRGYFWTRKKRIADAKIFGVNGTLDKSQVLFCLLKTYKFDAICNGFLNLSPSALNLVFKKNFQTAFSWVKPNSWTDKDPSIFNFLQELKLAVCGSQIVGLVPLGAMLLAADHFIENENLFILCEDQKIRLVSIIVISSPYRQNLKFGHFHSKDTYMYASSCCACSTSIVPVFNSNIRDSKIYDAVVNENATKQQYQ